MSIIVGELTQLLCCYRLQHFLGGSVSCLLVGELSPSWLRPRWLEGAVPICPGRGHLCGGTPCCQVPWPLSGVGPPKVASSLSQVSVPGQVSRVTACVCVGLSVWVCVCICGGGGVRFYCLSLLFNVCKTLYLYLEWVINMMLECDCCLLLLPSSAELFASLTICSWEAKQASTAQISRKRNIVGGEQRGLLFLSNSSPKRPLCLWKRSGCFTHRLLLRPPRRKEVEIIGVPCRCCNSKPTYLHNIYVVWWNCEIMVKCRIRSCVFDPLWPSAFHN